MQDVRKMTLETKERLNQETPQFVDGFNRLIPEQQASVKRYIWRQGQANAEWTAMLNTMQSKLD